MTGGAKRGPNTLFVGPPTRLGHAVNDFVRLNTTQLRETGIFAVSNKTAIHALRSAIGENPDGAEIDAVLTAAVGRQLFLSGLFALGRPATVLRDGAFFPEAERMLNGIAGALEGRIERVVVAIEPVHHLLLSVGRDEVVLQTARTRWEALYEASWVELVDVIARHFQGRDLVVLTPLATRDGTAPVLHHLFGEAGFEMASESSGATLAEEGRQKYKYIELMDKIGLDRVTCDLLDQRFDEDLKEIVRRPGVRVF